MKLGFIGMGNMAQALLSGFLRSGFLSADDAAAYAPHYDKLLAAAEKLGTDGKPGFSALTSASEVCSRSEVIIMACKPYQIEGVLSEIGSLLSNKALVSIAAGWPYEKYRKYLGSDVRIQFVMPNTPAMVGEGVFLFEQTGTLAGEEKAAIKKLFEAIGIVEELPSGLMGIGGALSGCGPAFVDLMIEAYADAGVRYGIPRETAYRLVAKTLLGSARLQLETGEHPGVLKDRVCSPAGTTIAGVAALEEKGFRAACLASIDAIMNKK